MTFRRYSDEKPKGPEKIGEVLSRLFVAKGWGRTTERRRLEDAWAKAAGASVAEQSRVLALKRGILEVEVRGAVLMQELASFHKRRLIDTLKRLLPGHQFKDLRFRQATS